jgi:pyruvate-formate lyase-activating enzyme
VLAWRAWSESRRGGRARTARGPQYCRALAGESDYNICINSDMTVSCNCRDFDGTGHIGDLTTQTLEEVFAGATPAAFQSALYEGTMPTSVCAICPERAVLPAERVADGPAACRVPTLGIMVENTARCNLRCPLCDRQRLLDTRRQSSLSLDDVDRVAAMLAHHGVRRVYYFNLGEPFSSASIREEVETLKSHLPSAQIFTSTNGVLLDRPGALEAALLMDYVYFSIDGIDQETLERYQRGGDFERSFGNMKRLVAMRGERGRALGGTRLPIVEWKYVLFRWNDRADHIRRALERAEDAGVDRLTFVPGEAPAREMSLRYFTDRMLETGRRSDVGIVFDLAPVPGEFD